VSVDDDAYIGVQEVAEHVFHSAEVPIAAEHEK
jgi:hypothetical protein